MVTTKTKYREVSKNWAQLAGQAASEKLASNTQILEVADLMGICDYFVITSGDNSRQVKAISEAVEEKLKQEVGVKPIYIEGIPDNWMLMDYGDIVVHVFSKKAREYYNLERLWSDCPEIPLM